MKLYETISYGYIKKQFNFNKLIDDKPGAYSVEFIQAGNPSNKDGMTN